MKKFFILFFYLFFTPLVFANDNSNNFFPSNLPNENISNKGYMEIPKEQIPNEENEQYVESNNSNSEVSAPVVDWNSYITDLCTAIKTNWQVQRGGASGRTVIDTVIGKNGELISADIKTSSGLKKLDNSALEAIKASSPFNPFPIDSTELKIHIPFKFFKATNSYNVTY